MKSLLLALLCFVIILIIYIRIQNVLVFLASSRFFGTLKAKAAKQVEVKQSGWLLMNILGQAWLRVPAWATTWSRSFYSFKPTTPLCVYPLNYSRNLHLFVHSTILDFILQYTSWLLAIIIIITTTSPSTLQYVFSLNRFCFVYNGILVCNQNTFFLFENNSPYKTLEANSLKVIFASYNTRWHGVLEVSTKFCTLRN